MKSDLTPRILTLKLAVATMYLGSQLELASCCTKNQPSVRYLTRDCCLSSVPQLCQIAKSRQKIKFKNSWKWLVIIIHVCNSLTNFWCEANAIIGHGNYLYLLKFVWINSWNDKRVTYFWRVLAIWNHCESPAPSPGLSCLACYFLVDSSFSIRGIPKQIIAFSMVFPPCHPAFTYLASHKL